MASLHTDRKKMTFDFNICIQTIITQLMTCHTNHDFKTIIRTADIYEFNMNISSN